MTIRNVSRIDIERAARLLEKSVEEMRVVASYMQQHNLEVLKCHWLTMSETYIPQIRRFIRGMQSKAKDQVESEAEGVPSSADFQIEKAKKDPRTRAGKLLQQQIQEAIDAALLKRELAEKKRGRPPKQEGK